MKASVIGPLPHCDSTHAIYIYCHTKPAQRQIAAAAVCGRQSVVGVVLQRRAVLLGGCPLELLAIKMFKSLPCLLLA